MTKEAISIGFVESFLLSGSAAVISKTIAAPIERVKLLLQNQGELLAQGKLNEPYKGITDCAVRTFRNEGLLPFWRGNLASCIRYFPMQAFNFAFKDRIQSVFRRSTSDSYGVMFLKNIVAGGCAGILSVTITYSLDFARTKLANDTKVHSKGSKGGVGEREFRGIIDVYRKTIASDGILGLYRGYSISCFTIFIYRGCYFGFYDSLKPLLLNEDASLIASFCLGYSVTVSSGLIVYPLDTVRRRYLLTSSRTNKYTGPIHCATVICQQEGPRALMKGATANVLRGIAGAGVLAGFDKFKAAYVRMRSKAYAS